MIEVENSERLSRFLFFSRWFARAAGRVKPEAFVPYRYVELSVSCTEGLKESVVWEIGRETAESRADNPTLHGRADTCAEVIRAQGLEVVRDDHPRFHANIVGWESERAAQISKAQQIAATAKLVLADENV